MTWPTGPLLPLLALIWPLALGAAAALPPLRARSLYMLPLAPLPALVLAFVPGAAETRVPDLLFGVVLGLDAGRALLLGMTAAVWLAAGLHAVAAMGQARNKAVFAGFWCLTLSGNLGVFLALDVVTFYVSFAAVSLAAYFLVVHDRDARALRAGRLYIVLAMLGEAGLLAGFIIGATAADSLLIADIRGAFAAAPLGGPAVALLILGFGIKVGLVPLHIWLPLAHPAAPVAGSAVLSGAIVKAGIIGLILFVPPGGWWATILVVLGIASALGGVVAGLMQAGAKAVLAYSTVSQLGLVVALIGAGQAADPVLFYAFHHGLAKAALFLSVGVLGALATRHAWPAWLCAALVAASVAGLPLTGGAVVKLAAKTGLGEVAALLLTASGVGTALLLARFLLLVRPRRDGTANAGVRPMLLPLPWLALTGAALLLPWWLWPSWSDGRGYGYLLETDALWDGLWPVFVAGALVAAVLAARLKAPLVPEGDIAGWYEGLARRLAGAMRGPAFAAAPAWLPPRWPRRYGARLDAVEAALTGRLGLGIAALLLVLALALLAG